MKRYLVLVLVSAAAVLVEALPQVHTVGGVRPEMTLVLVVWLAFSHDWEDIVLPLFVIGLVRDVYSMWHFGYYAGMYLLVGGAIAVMRTAIFRRNPVSQVVMTGVASLVVNLPALGWQVLGGQVSLSSGLGLWSGLALYTGLVAPLGFFVLGAFDKTLSFQRLWQIGRTPGMPRRS
ncbi:MAG: rod shape-determining protein MreD, partial [Planctomycetota bacterium]